MKIIPIEQNTEEWLEFRKGRSGGSGLHDLYPSRAITREQATNHLIAKGQDIREKASAKEILEMLTAEDIGKLKATGDKKDAFYKLVAEKVARPITPNDYLDKLNGQAFSMMARGHILEPEAIAEFEKRHKLKVDEHKYIWQRDDNPDSILSPDFTIGDKVAGEVKCLDSHRIIRAWHEKRYPSEYHEQVVKYFIVNEKLEKLYFVLFTDTMVSLPYLEFVIKRKDIENDIQELKAFEDAIIKQINALADELEF